MEAIKALVKNPPRLREQMANAIETVIKNINKLNILGGTILEDYERLDVADAQDRGRARATYFVTVIDNLLDVLVGCTLKNMAEHCVPFSMKDEMPWPATMAIFQVIGLLLVVGEDVRIILPNPQHRHHKWKSRVSAMDNAYVAKMRLCVTDTPLDRYTMLDLDGTLWVISVNQHCIQPCDELEKFFFALLYRAAMISAQPGWGDNHNIPELCTQTDEVRPQDGRRQLIANSKFNRRMGGTLFRLLFSARIFKIMRPGIANPWGAPRRSIVDVALDYIPNVRRYICFQADMVLRASAAKTEISQGLARVMLTFGDLERFIERRGVEMPRFQSVLMEVKTPMTQQYWARTGEFIRFDRVVACMREDDPGGDDEYFSRYTALHHAYALLTKTYLINTAFTEFDIDFFKDFIVWENELPHKLKEIEEVLFPVIIHVFGKMHVVYKARTFKCICVEHAISLWFIVIRTFMRSQLRDRNIFKAIDAVINNRTSDDQARLATAVVVMGAATLKPNTAGEVLE